ncbi:hypothetical protein JW988_05345 [Candidatus Bathyarchaeota archaeon]|nr:hypothetical protein [Candidatus Bathyarchaeota archaeon]
MATASAKQPKQMSKLQTAAIVIIAFTVTIATFYYLGIFDDFQVIDGGDSTPEATPLTAARNLEGTWKTTFPVKFYIKTDFETFGELEDVGSENRTMTWIITATNDENTVNVEVYFTVSDRQLVSDSGYTPDVSPMFLTGTISGTRLTLKTGDRTICECNFTTDIITGTWSDYWSMVYEQEVYTATNSLILTRQ